MYENITINGLIRELQKLPEETRNRQILSLDSRQGFYVGLCDPHVIILKKTKEKGDHTRGVILA